MKIYHDLNLTSKSNSIEKEAAPGFEIILSSSENNENIILKIKGIENRF